MVVGLQPRLETSYLFVVVRAFSEGQLEVNDPIWKTIDQGVPGVLAFYHLFGLVLRILRVTFDFDLVLG